MINFPTKQEQKESVHLVHELLDLALHPRPGFCRTIQIGQDGSKKQVDLPVSKDGLVNFGGPL